MNPIVGALVTLMMKDESLKSQTVTGIVNEINRDTKFQDPAVIQATRDRINQLPQSRCPHKNRRDCNIRRCNSEKCKEHVNQCNPVPQAVSTSEVVPGAQSTANSSNQNGNETTK